MKKILIFVTVMMMLLCLTACGSDTQEATTEDNTKQTTTQNNQDATTPEATDESFDYGEAYLSERLQGDYSITYQLTYYTEGEDPYSQTITCAKAGADYFIKMGEESTIIYVKNGEGYDMYVGDATGAFTQIPGVLSTQEEVSAATLPFWGYMTAYDEYDDGLHKTGTATIADRDCNQYTYEGAYLDNTAKYDYYIDKETGACLKYYIEVNSSDVKGSYEFECTEFKTSGVSLPDYK